MNGAWLEELLPQAIISPRFRVLWLVFFLLFPLAYVGGVVLAVWEERLAQVAGAVDRAMSIKAAQRFAESKGVSVAGWNHYVTVETHDDLLSYYGNVQKPDLAAVSSLAPAREVTVLFTSPDMKTEFRTYMSLTGEVAGFDMGKSASIGRTNIMVGAVNITSTDSHSTDKTTAAAGDQKAESIARGFLASNDSLSRLLKFEAPAKAETSSDDPARTDVSWDASPASEKELALNVAVSVRDGHVVAQRVTAKLDEDYRKSNLPKKSSFPVIWNSIYGAFLSFSALYAIYRYAKRTFQKEVSHPRTLIVAALFCISYSIYIYSLAVDQVAARVSAARFKSILLAADVSAFIAFAFMGLLVGIAYGSGEGEVREAYPGKLTPLDALLAGRIFSRDVSAAILFGAATAAWLLLCQHALAYFLPTDMVGARSEGLQYTFARLPWLTLLMGRQWMSLLIAVAGLLLPASFLSRSKARGKRRFIWLILFAILSVLHDGAAYPTLASSLLAMGVLVSALLLPFFAFDLLAAIVSLSSLAFVNELARLSAVFPSWIPFALGLAAIAAATLAVATYLALRGQPVLEDDVRPLYAKNLAERMGLQAEVLAAREAQLRLMPQAAPQLQGMQVAACCIPAKGVGGDFYDFFHLDANRIGIFVAQGGERGLASALCIALAKGVLMHALQQTHSAAQIVAQLEAGMAKLLQGGTGTDISFAYAVFDSNRQLLNYARVGDSPRVLIHRRETGFANSAQLESRANFPGRAESAPAIHEGAAHLNPGDHIIFFTDGVTALRLRRFGRSSNQWLSALPRELGRQDEPLQTLLVSSLTKYRNSASEDLTAVVLRAVGSEAVRQEGVA